MSFIMEDDHTQRDFLLGAKVVTPEPEKPALKPPTHLTDGLDIAYSDRIADLFSGMMSEGVMRIQNEDGSFFGEVSFVERMRLGLGRSGARG